MAASTTNGLPAGTVADDLGQDVPIDYASYLSELAHKWKPSGIRGLFPLEQRPGMISMLAGKPNPSTFPFGSLSITLQSPPGVTANDEQTTITVDGEDLAEGLQYAATAGLPRLNAWMVELQRLVHGRGDPQQEGWKCSVGSGSQDLLVKVFAALCNPGDAVLVETPAYSGTLGFLRPMDLHLIEVDVDADGLSSSRLATILDNWHSSPETKHLPFPKILYTIPTGSNPTGYTAPTPRRREVLSLCRRHQLLIVEDDVYYHLHWDKKNRPPSYWSLDAQDSRGAGRVVRLDSFSKILSSGMRLGLLCGPTPIVEIVNLHTANTNLQPSSTTQALALALLRHWGHARFLEHCEHVAAFYLTKRDMLEAAARKHLQPEGEAPLAEWVSPGAGMFLWLKLNIAREGEQGDSSSLISHKAVERGILAVPGFAFMPSGRATEYVRTSYSLITLEDADEGFRRLALVIREARNEAGL